VVAASTVRKKKLLKWSCSMTFRITGLSPEPFRPLYGLADERLSELGVKRYRVDRNPGYPDRVEMRDAAIGETVLLLNHCHQTGDTPYRASHAVFVREGAEEPYDRLGEVPQVLRSRLLSLRAFDASHMMVDADVVEGTDIEALIARLFKNPGAAYIQAHYAKRGCYAGRIDRN